MLSNLRPSRGNLQMSESFQRFIRALEENGYREGRQFRCPAHDDHRPSLSVTEGRDGRVLLKCHTGCTPEDIVAALGLTMADLFNENGSRPMRTPIATYCRRGSEPAHSW